MLISLLYYQSKKRRIVSHFCMALFQSQKSTNAINIIAWVSVTAIAFATAALLVLWSAFNGFEDLVKSLYTTFYPDLKINAATGKTLILTPFQVQQLKNLEGIKAVSLTVEEKALLQNDDYTAIVDLKGVDSNYTAVTNISQNIMRGKYYTGDAENPGAVLGVGVENALAVLSDRSIGGLRIVLPKRGDVNLADPLTAFNEGTIMPFGAFAVQEEFDNKYVITNIDFVKTHMDFKADEYSEVELAVTQQGNEDRIKKEIKNLLGKDYTIQTRYEQNSSLYNVMRFEKYAIYGIFILVLIVASFNMIGALSMLVLENRKIYRYCSLWGQTKAGSEKYFSAKVYCWLL